MLSSEIVLKKYTDIKISIKETLRYMGCDGRHGEVTEEICSLAKDCAEELAPLLDCSVLSCIYPLELCGENKVKIGCCGETESKSLYKNLSGCTAVIIFAATIGFDCDRLLAKYKKIMPSRAVAVQAAGTAAIEELCDTFCNEEAGRLGQDGLLLKPRFSPGYGDFDIGFQRNIFTALECSKRTGITLKESCLMIPSKSVTAAVGIYGR
ncbi:MAG: Vitamin B12 dependent methionine synthase activation subunit [Clostridia bacterium]|nr:Vitamin B12 dependent methionine synthase activation subunit [Clostridia bacterium]